jgi:flagellar biosynthesis chaperone FliJ
MTGFKFRLESALRWRHLQVEAETAKLAGLNEQLQQLRRSLAEAQQQRKQACAFVQGEPMIQSADLRALSSFTLGIEARVNSLKEALVKMEQRVYDQQLLLRKAEQNEGALNRLRARGLSAWRVRFDRETEATAQELWLYSHTTDRDGGYRR